ncbi:MAG: hypothetical protein U1C71_02005, partial [archaeon]|nr:hypothetical protein [archaeon]
VNHPTGKKYAHLLKDFPVYPVFRDAKGKILSMPPIINSQHAGQVTPEDRDLFVEVSGHYWPTVSVILDILAHLFTDMKGDIHEVQIHFFNEQQPRVTPELATRLVPLEIDVVNRTLGTSFTSEQVSQLLGRMLYGVPKMNPKQVVVEVPSFRVDVLHPLDLVDDVARAYGFDNLSPMEVALSTRGGILPQTQLNADIRLALVGMGFQEVMTGILTAHAHHFTSFDREESPHITLGVVKEKGLTMVRNMLYPETMRALLANRSKRLPFRLFELDQVVVPDSHTETGTRTVYKLCTLSGHASASFEEMKGMVEALAQVLGEKPVFAPMGNPTFIPGRSATVTMGHRSGFMGELHPRILERLSIPFPIVLFEMNVD